MSGINKSDAGKKRFPRNPLTHVYTLQLRYWLQYNVQKIPV